MDSNKSTQATKIPDFYALLKIAPKQADLQVIRQALRRLADRLERLEDRRIAQQANKLMMLAQQTLLDDQRKAAYDSLWEKVYGARVATIPDATTVPPPISHPVSHSQQFEAILPPGDPMAPLDLASYLKSVAPPNLEQSRSDFDRLMKMLSEKLPTDSQAPSNTEGTPLAADRGITIDSVPSVISNSKPLNRSNRRRQRDRSYLLTLLGSIVILIGILAVLVVQLNRNRVSSALIEPPSTRIAPDLIQKEDPSVASTSVRRSGLPAVKGLEPNDLQPMEIASDQSESDTRTEQSLGQSLPSNQKDMRRDSTAETRESGAMQENVLPMTESQEDSQIALSAEERNRWRDSMIELRDALRAGEMSRAEELAAHAKTVAQTRQQEAHILCGAKIMSLLQSYQLAIQDAAGSLDAGQTFRVGSQEVAVVQSGLQQIVVRVAGKNQTYQINRLPLRLSLALADLSLPADDPQSLAMKAVQVAISANPAEDLLENARGWMQAAIEASAVPQGIMAFFEDDFRLD